MPTTRINLQIDDKFAQMLAYLKKDYPLLADPDLIKIAVGKFYNQVKHAEHQQWVESLPDLQLTAEQKAKLESNLEESINSGFTTWNKEDFIKDMMN
jgi:hypothetical protein